MSKAGGRKAKQQKLEQPPQQSEEMMKKNRPQDAASTRAKNSGHGKVTADKWNQ